MFNPACDYVCVCGYGWSGSSVVSDILREFANCYVFGMEFLAVKDPYALDDLYHAAFTKDKEEVDNAVKDFLDYMDFLFRPNGSFHSGLGYERFLGENFRKAVRKFVSSIVSFEYENEWYMFDFKRGKVAHILKYNIFSRIIRKVLRKLSLISNLQSEKSYFIAVDKPEFLKSAQEFIDDIFAPFRASHVILDQGISIFNYKAQMNYFRDVKMIVVDRDPLDNYADFIKVKYTIGREFAKNRSVNKYIAMHKAARRDQEKLKNDPSILFLRFEDLIYRYDDSLKLIADFIGLDMKEHIHKRKFFNPDISVKNIGQYKNVLSDLEIEAITYELANYLYVQ